MDQPLDIPGYKIMEKAGQGGMADVYLGVQENLERQVAIKVLVPALFRDEQFLQRFLKEARTAAKLVHPNIITIHDVGQSGSTYYIVMEYLPRGLKHKISGKELSPQAAFSILYQLAGALDYAHQKGFVHRDLKPENILFREDGTPVLVDFGIAKAMDTATKLTATGMSIGTPHYMSPEQARGEKVDGRSDFYSLGVILYEMLTGSTPYESESTAGLLIKHIQEPVPRLPEKLKHFQPIIDRMMAKNPGERIQNGRELIRFIEEPTTDTGRLQEPPEEPETAGPTGSRKVLVGVLAVVLAVLVGALIILLNQGKEPPVQKPVIQSDNKKPILEIETDKVPAAPEKQAAAEEKQVQRPVKVEKTRKVEEVRLSPEETQKLNQRLLRRMSSLKPEEAAKILKMRGIDVNLQDKYGRTPLHKAATSGKREIAALLISSGAEVDTRDKNDWTPLHHAARSGKTETVRLLIEKGADVKARQRYGRTPLRMAATYGFVETVKVLIEKGADINSRDKYSETILHAAAKSGRTPVVEVLVKNGADVNVKNNSGTTPLHMAENKATAEILITNGAGVNAKEDDGETPLHRAAYSKDGEKELVAFLIEKGADPNARDNRGETPLYKAAEYGRTGKVEILIAKGADVNARSGENKKGDSPLHMAAGNGKLETVRLLLSKGADVNARNQKGQTPLAYALHGNKSKSAEVLRKHGAR